MSFRVTWRKGGTREGAEAWETFNPNRGPEWDLPHALAFKAAVEANHHDWPPYWAPKIGYCDPALMAAAEAAAKAPAAHLFRELCERHVNALSGTEPGTVRKYRQLLRDHVYPHFPEGLDCADEDSINELFIGEWIGRLRDGRRNPEYERRDAAEVVDDDDFAPEGWDGEAPDEWITRPLSPKTVRNVHGLFSAIVQRGVDIGWRAKNPCTKTGKTLPNLDDGEGDEEMVFLEVWEYEHLVEEMKPDARPLTRFLFKNGTRYSEATALRVGDLSFTEDDFDDAGAFLGTSPSVMVWRAWKQDKAGRWYTGPPKTKAGRRRVDVDREQAEDLLPLIKGKAKKDLIFTGPRGGRWIHSTFYTRRWRPAVYRAVRCPECRSRDWEALIGRRGMTELTKDQIVWCGHKGRMRQVPRVHDARHTHVAFCIAAGGKPLAICRRLGHSSIKVTYDRYGHLLDSVESELIFGLTALLAGAPSGPGRREGTRTRSGAEPVAV